MAILVVGGAQLKCTGGTAPGTLQIQRSSSVNAGAKLTVVATVTGGSIGVRVESLGSSSVNVSRTRSPVAITSS